MEYAFRCDCPFTTALDVLGDKWMLVIVKHMLIEGRETFKDFMEGDEGIASNILTAKLKLLENLQIVSKSKLTNNRKTNIYRLTEKGLALAPVLVELAFWSDKHLRNVHPGIANGEPMKHLREDRAAFTKMLVNKYRNP